MEELVVLFLEVRDSAISVDGFHSSSQPALELCVMLDRRGCDSRVKAIKSLFSNGVEFVTEQFNSAPETDDEDYANDEQSGIEHGLFLCLLVSETNLDEIQPNA